MNRFFVLKLKRSNVVGLSYIYAHCTLDFRPHVYCLLFACRIPIHSLLVCYFERDRLYISLSPPLCKPYPIDLVCRGLERK